MNVSKSTLKQMIRDAEAKRQHAFLNGDEFTAHYWQKLVEEYERELKLK